MEREGYIFLIAKAREFQCVAGPVGQNGTEDAAALHSKTEPASCEVASGSWDGVETHPGMCNPLQDCHGTV